MDRSSIPAPKRCTSYHSGHTVHWIQALHTANKPEVAARTRSGTLRSISGEVIEIRLNDGDVVRYRNHETGRLSAVTGGTGPVSVNDQYSVLRAGGFCFSVDRDTDSRCSPVPPMTQPARTPPRWPNGCTRTAGSPPRCTMADPATRC